MVARSFTTAERINSVKQRVLGLSASVQSTKSKFNLSVTRARYHNESFPGTVFSEPRMSSLERIRQFRSRLLRVFFRPESATLRHSLVPGRLATISAGGTIEAQFNLQRQVP